MRLTITSIREGLHPKEMVVAIKTTEGTQRLVVSRSTIDHDEIEVGLIRLDGSRALIELPRETQTGEWRVWVSSDQLKEDLKVA